MEQKMKIGGLIFGNTTADTQKVIEANDSNLNHCLATNRKLATQDYEAIHAHLSEAVPQNCDLFFVDEILTEAQAIDVSDADLYVVYSFGGVTDKTYVTLLSKNKPILILQPPYEKSWSYGGVYFPYFVRDNREISDYLGISEDVTVIKSSEELKKTLSAYQVKFRMEHAVVMCAGEPMYEPFHSWSWGYSIVKAMQQKFGLKWINLSSEKILDIYNNWEKEYPKEQILNEVSGDYVKARDAIPRVEKLYYVFKELIEENQVTAFTVNCLASIVHTGINGTACYALSKLNDSGIVAACESDITTLLAMMITSFASNRPVFMLNPYLFPADNKLFVSHCSCPTLHSYEEGSKQDPLNLYNYFEIDSMGCGIQVMREPGDVTIVGLAHNSIDRMVIVKGRMVRNTSFASCRTQMEIEIDGDIQDLANNYQGRHWALVYGDYTDALVRANELMDIESIII